jgi:hypothetical protein
MAEERGGPVCLCSLGSRCYYKATLNHDLLLLTPQKDASPNNLISRELLPLSSCTFHHPRLLQLRPFLFISRHVRQSKTYTYQKVPIPVIRAQIMCSLEFVHLRSTWIPRGQTHSAYNYLSPSFLVSVGLEPISHRPRRMLYTKIDFNKIITTSRSLGPAVRQVLYKSPSQNEPAEAFPRI